MFPNFSVEPSFCDVKETCVISKKLYNGDSAIKLTNKVSTFFYDELVTQRLLDDYQEVTCTAKSTSKWGEGAVEEDASYRLTFLNPCTDKDFVMINKPALPDKTYTIASDPLRWNH